MVEWGESGNRKDGKSIKRPETLTVSTGLTEWVEPK